MQESGLGYTEVRGVEVGQKLLGRGDHTWHDTTSYYQGQDSRYEEVKVTQCY